MTIATFPTIAPAGEEFWLEGNTIVFESPATKKLQRLEFDGQRWRFEVEFAALGPDAFRSLQAFFASLAGAAGEFYYAPKTFYTPRGTGLGTPQVNGAGQIGRSLVIDQATANQAQFLRKGDLFSYNTPNGGREMKIIQATTATNGAGQATLTFEPPIVQSPTDNSAITVVGASCIVRMADDNQGRIRYSAPYVNIGQPAVLSLIEVVKPP